MLQIALVVLVYHQRLINGDSQAICVCFDRVPIQKRIMVNRIVQEEPQAQAAANPDTRKKRKSDTDLCIANKQMHDKHKDQHPDLIGQKNT